MLFCFASCTTSGENEQVVVPIDSEPEYLDPQIVSETGAKNVIANCFEGLLIYDESGNLTEGACESYSVSSNGLVYTFKLRTDGRWRVTNAAKETILKYYETDENYDFSKDFDTAVKADDFVFAFRRALQPETKCPYAQSLMNIKNAAEVNSGKLKSTKLGVKAKDDYTLVITLQRKDADFLSALTSPACVPCNEEFFEITRGHYGLSADYLIYNGPFYISNWAEKTAITARRNDYYRATQAEIEAETADASDEVKPSSIYFSFNNEQSTRDRKVKDGTYCMAPFTNTQASEFSDSRSVSVKTVNSAVTSLIFNLSDEILANADIRKAIAYSFDTSGLLQFLKKESAGGVVPSASVVNAKSYRTLVTASGISLDKKKAQTLFKSGLEKLEADDIELTILCLTDNENAVRSVMQSWQSVFGAAFSISVEPLEREALMSRVKTGDYQLALYDISYTDTTAQNALVRYISGARDNIVNLNSSSYDKLISEVSKAGSEKAKIKALKSAENYLIQNCIMVPVCETEVYYGISKGVSGISFNPTGEVAYFKNTLIK